MKGLLERLKDGETIVIAEGYLWEIERRGFAQFGSQVPVVVLEKPDEVETLHEEFALAGSDVIEAFTYFGHREYMKMQGREDELEKLNRDALSIARKVANKYDKLLAGGLSNTPLYSKDDKDSHQKIYEMFKEQVIWCVEGGVDYIIGETFDAFGEAELALRAIKEYGNGCPAVITMAAHIPDYTTDDIPIPEALKRLEDQGAAVVGLNCSRGPDMMMSLLKKVREVCKGPLAAIPVPYKTTDNEKTFYALKDQNTGKYLYPHNLDQARNSREDIRKFAEEAKTLGVQYIGLCCGNYPSLIREVAEVYGKKPPASKYAMKGAWISGEVPKTERVKKIRRFMVGE